MTPALPLSPPSLKAPWLTPYWEGLGEGELRLPRCSRCGKWQWYPVESGPACDGAGYVWEAVGPLATVFSFTRVERPMLADVDAPYVTGLVVTDQAPDCRIVAFFDETAGSVAIGAKVRLQLTAGTPPFPYFILEDRP